MCSSDLSSASPHGQVWDDSPFVPVWRPVSYTHLDVYKRQADSRAGEEGRTQVFSCALLYGAYGKEHVKCLSLIHI